MADIPVESEIRAAAPELFPIDGDGYCPDPEGSSSSYCHLNQAALNEVKSILLTKRANETITLNRGCAIFLPNENFGHPDPENFEKLLETHSHGSPELHCNNFFIIEVNNGGRCAFACPGCMLKVENVAKTYYQYKVWNIHIHVFQHVHCTWCLKAIDRSLTNCAVLKIAYGEWQEAAKLIKIVTHNSLCSLNSTSHLWRVD